MTSSSPEQCDLQDIRVLVERLANLLAEGELFFEICLEFKLIRTVSAR